jgi:hypothetical protein
MSDLIDYLHVDYDLAGLDREDTEARLRIKIEEVPSNRFHSPIPGEKGIRHFRLDLYAEIRYMDAEDGEPEEWHQPNCSLSGAEVATDSVLPFYMSTHGSPHLRSFKTYLHRMLCRPIRGASPPNPLGQVLTENPKNGGFVCLHEATPQGLRKV